MPGLDYVQLRAEVTINEVLRLLHFRPSHRRGNTLRGHCLLCQVDLSPESTGPPFSVDLDQNLFHCFRCKMGGNQLDLWRLARAQPLYPASLHLCERLGKEPPWLTSSHTKPQSTPATQSPIHLPGQPANWYRQS